MALLSSKTLIQGHALFLFLLAVYLTKSPNVIIESDLVFMLGELLHIVRFFTNSILPKFKIERIQENLTMNDRTQHPASPAPNPPSPSAVSSS